jgi:hypothetical protein
MGGAVSPRLDKAIASLLEMIDQILTTAYVVAIVYGVIHLFKVLGHD